MDLNMRPDDHEAAMARADLYKMANYSFKLFKMVKDGDQLEGWVQAKITKAADYIASVYHYLEYEMKFSEYGEKIENSDMYSESVKAEFRQKLVEAKQKMKKLKQVHEVQVMSPPDGATAPPPKGKDGQYPIVTSGPHKGKRWSPQTPGPTNPAFKEALKGGQKKLDVDKDGKLEKSDFAKLRGSKGVKEAAAKCNHTAKGKSCPVHGLKECGTMSEGFPTVADAKARAEKEKTTGKFDVKKTSTGTQYTRKASTFTDGGDDKDTKNAKKKAKSVKEGSKPDFLDMDKDGNKKEPMKKAVADKKAPPKKGVNPFAKK